MTAPTPLVAAEPFQLLRQRLRQIKGSSNIKCLFNPSRGLASQMADLK
jgi:hypothetical protein